MAELPAQHQTLAPFGGITRIRFKGSPASHRTLSHRGSPAVVLLAQNRTRICEVNVSGPRKGGCRLPTRWGQRVPPDGDADASLSGGRCLRRDFRVGVKDADPLAVCRVPDRANIVGA